MQRGHDWLFQTNYQFSSAIPARSISVLFNLNFPSPTLLIHALMSLSRLVLNLLDCSIKWEVPKEKVVYD